MIKLCESEAYIGTRVELLDVMEERGVTGIIGNYSVIGLEKFAIYWPKLSLKLKISIE